MVILAVLAVGDDSIYYFWRGYLNVKEKHFIDWLSEEPTATLGRCVQRPGRRQRKDLGFKLSYVSLYFFFSNG